jgi:FAD/FMN-containing dehydrogenase
VGPIVLGGMLLYPAAMGRELLRFYRAFMRDAPDEVGSGMAFITAPPADFVPPPARGKPVIGVVAVYVGDPSDGEKAFAPLRAFGPPAVDLIERMPYVALQQMLDPANVKGMRNYWTADFYDDLPDEAVDTLVERATAPVSPLTQILVVPGGGAVARIDDDATAFGERKAAWNIHYLSVWADPSADAENIAYTRAVSGAMKPWTTGRVYLNYIGEEGSGRVRSAFGSAKYERLRGIKRVWDPTNLFHHNQNIPPA